ncbi:MAG TPA: chemotaxis protein CheB, partial [candidate division Zixibacteria bacterium]|nr:chemotaxis protein CheB [candidate division Zixibacteria bacterium]
MVRRAPQPPKILPIVGIGASAGGLEAFTRLLAALPENTGMAFVLVQHLEPQHESMLSRLLARATKMSVQEIHEGMRIQPNRVYVIPANADLSLMDGLLHVEGRRLAGGHHLPIDYFLRSLAYARKSQAIGVVLSGTASDGTAGLQAVKARGGITFAQEPSTAKYDGMPRSAIAAGCVDFVLPPERIAAELARIAHHPFVAKLPRQSSEELLAKEDDWTHLFRLLRSARGVDFTFYKKSTIKRRLARRMALHKLESLGDYLKFLERTREELDALFHEILIPVTGFFRDAEVFTALRSKIFPQILRARRPEHAVRIWVPGCSAG